MKPDIFQFDDQPVRVAMIDDEPWFVAADAGRILGIGNVRQSLVDFPDDEKGVTTTDTLGGGQAMTVLSEPGLYRLIFQSRKAEAERFKKWVFAEVLPAIRKTGGYWKSGGLTGGDGDVVEVRGLVLTALRGLAAGTVPLGRARVTAQLAAQYFRSWNLALESEVSAEVPRLHCGGSAEDWLALGRAAVETALTNVFWPLDVTLAEGEGANGFVVTSAQLATLAAERNLLPCLENANVPMRVGMGVGEHLAGKPLEVPPHGLWEVTNWRSKTGRGWEFSRVEAAA